jgi:hypothetical protein
VAAAGDTELASIRQAIRTERKLRIAYLDAGRADAARSGRSRSAFRPRASSWRGASCGRISGIFAPTASRR